MEQVSEAGLRRKITSSFKAEQNLIQKLDPPTVDGVRGFLGLVSRTVDELNHQVGVPEDRGPLVKSNILCNGAVSSLFAFCAGDVHTAASSLLTHWEEAVATVVKDSKDFVSFRLHFTAEARKTRSTETRNNLARVFSKVSLERTQELIAYYAAALPEEINATIKGNQMRLALIRLMSALDLSFDEVGRMFGVSGETVRRWARQTNEVPEEKAAIIQTADSALSRILSHVKSHRVAAAIRRPAKAFDGRSALALILDGRIAQVAHAYEFALSYQQ